MPESQKPSSHLHIVVKHPRNCPYLSLLLITLCAAAVFVVGLPQSFAAEIGMAGMPYVAIHHPKFVPASKAGFLHSNDLLIGVAYGKVAKAYPAAALAQHGIVEDQMPNGPIAVTWCSICNTALVFRASADGKKLTFVPDGLRGANEALKDFETGSRWQQSTFTAIAGPLKGTHLELYPFLLTTWSEWRREHPATLVLKPQPGYLEEFPTVNTILRQGALGMGGPAPEGAFGHDKRLQPMVTIVGLETGGKVKAYPMPLLARTRVVNDTVGGAPVVIVHQPASDTTTAFVAKAGGRRLEFRAANEEASRLTDLETHSTWTAFGRAIAGPEKGTQLKRIILEPEFWFAWSEFHPDTLLYASNAGR